MSSTNKDSWLRDYNLLVELGARIGVKIRERDSTSSGTKANSSINKLLREYEQKLTALKGSLHKLSSNYSISDSEYDRRKKMIDELSTKFDQLSKSKRVGWSDDRDFVSHDMGGAGPGSAHRMSVDEIRQEQRQMIAEQDKGLENLSKALRRQQEVGLAMQDEITEHNALIDDIQEATGRTDDRIKFQTRRVEEVRRKDSCKCTCALVSVILLLLLAIIVIAAVPYNGKA